MNELIDLLSIDARISVYIQRLKKTLVLYSK